MTTNYIWQINIGKQIFRLPGQGVVLALFLNVNNQAHVTFGMRQTCSLSIEQPKPSCFSCYQAERTKPRWAKTGRWGILTYRLLFWRILYWNGEKIFLKCASHTATLVLLIDNLRIQLGMFQHVGCKGAEFLKYITSCSSLWRIWGFLGVGGGRHNSE